MSQIITKGNYMDAQYDVFKKFSTQWAIVNAGTADDFNCMTLGWGMMGNIWGHPGAALTIYVQPSRYTFEYMERSDYFTVCFLPEQYHKAAEILGTVSGRDCDKVAMAGLTPKNLENGIGYEEAELTFVCKKICSQQFDINCVPEHMREGMYSKLEPHYMYIGYIEDAFGEMKEWQ